MLDAELGETPSESPHLFQESLVRLAPVGTFDLAAAAALERVVARLSVGVQVVLDFSAVRQVEDRALLSVARALERFPGADHTLSGLTLHQRSVLHYLSR